ncbi:MAG: GAF domain-containing sensor histidine kinase, partial [Methylobacteriaceae bacterium]|nr:GAF domain-containing sensor histidine kinase [Methylobacteriaceae bacterium]
TQPPSVRAGRRRAPAPAVQLHSRERELEIVGAIAQALNGSTEVNAALATALSLTAEHLSLRTGWIFLFDNRTGSPYLAAAQELPPGLAADPRRMTGSCYCLETIAAGDIENAAGVNVLTCSRLKWLTGRDAKGLRFHASTPISFQGRCLGVLNVASAAWRELSAAELRLMRVIGDMLGVAVERSRLYAGSLQAGAIEERNRLAREIHDTVAQGLSAVALRLDTVDALLSAEASRDSIRAEAAEALRLTRQSLDEVRRSVLDLRAAPLEGRTLGQAVAALAERERSSPVKVKAEIVGNDRALPPHIEAGLYRIAQEALANALRHGGPRCVLLQLTFRPDGVTLVVEDDGSGFAADIPAPGRFGLVGLRERARLIGGTLEVSSAIGTGTRVAAAVPLTTRTPGA